ncbi:hypothetical protein DACRYDRAFT_107124 [Dacryopinax primogenitus]|uniref:Ribosomal protein/NADH dehydrogenase domain-containing protein n=1 Tax=Dacryopinax primogenitus (strain DJM 731) TaxID=1858805 RepID=M5G8N0_DACPD|nr:uncharacterized protein DACRYDRAFT_107124 [Dacryopinax primogenitus]EJU02187.1 hypothetical protein DACRYDRAFT_107124 [Dacryopinax primogenitus]
MSRAVLSSSSPLVPLTKKTSLTAALRKLTPPIPLRENVRKVVLSFNKDAHASARNFARDIYPRLAFSNKHVAFTVSPLPKPPQPDAGSPPEWLITLENGEEKRLPLPVSERPGWILKKLVDEAGATQWDQEMLKSREEEEGSR